MFLFQTLIDAIFAASMVASPVPLVSFTEPVVRSPEPELVPVLVFRGLSISTPGIAAPTNRNALTPEDPSIAIAIGRQLRGLDLELTVTHAFDGSPYEARLDELSATPGGAAFDLTATLTAAYKF